MKVALVRGPFLRASGVRPWERLHTHSDDFDITAFVSDPSRHDTSSLEMPVESLPWYDGKLSISGHEHFFFDALSKFKLPRAVLGGIRKLADEYDVVHTSENFNLFSLQAARACSKREAFFTFTAGENIPFYPHSLPTSLHKSYVNGHADGATATTIEGKRALIHEGVPHTDIDVIPNALDLSTFEPRQVGAAEVGLPDDLDDSFTLLFVHRLCEQKGTPYLVKAFERFQREVSDASLILVGADELDDESVRQHIDDNPDVYHLSHVPHDQIGDLYNFSDLFVLPSVTLWYNEEQFGMALIEAMACETPSVVTNVGGLPHVAQHRETSLVVDERSVSVLYEAFVTLYNDTDLRESLARSARRYAEEHYAPSVVADVLSSFYLDTVGVPR